MPLFIVTPRRHHAHEEFMRMLYDWALRNASADATEDFAQLTAIPCIETAQFLRHAARLSVADKLILATGCVKRFFKYSAVSDIVVTTEREEQEVLKYSDVADTGAHVHATPSLDRRALATLLRNRATPILGRPDRTTGAVWKHELTLLNDWRLRTEFDTGGRETRQLQYSQSLLREGEALVQNVSLLAWRGISATTMWSGARTVTDVIIPAVTVCSLFVQASKELLPRL